MIEDSSERRRQVVLGAAVVDAKKESFLPRLRHQEWQTSWGKSASKNCAQPKIVHNAALCQPFRELCSRLARPATVGFRSCVPRPAPPCPPFMYLIHKIHLSVDFFCCHVILLASIIIIMTNVNHPRPPTQSFLLLFFSFFLLFPSSILLFFFFSSSSFFLTNKLTL